MKCRENCTNKSVVFPKLWVLKGKKKLFLARSFFFFTVHFTQNSFFYRGPGVCKCCRVYACVAEVTLLIKGAELFQLRNDYSWNVLQV